jgi:hypothetical protein
MIAGGHVRRTSCLGALALLAFAAPALAQTTEPAVASPAPAQIAEPLPPAEVPPPASEPLPSTAPAVVAPAAETAPSATPAVPESKPLVLSDPPRGFMYHPSGPTSDGKAGGFRLSLGMLFDGIDTRTLQGLHAPVPQFMLYGRFQLPEGVSILAQFQFIFVMNQLELGAGWSTQLGGTGFMAYVLGGSLIGTLNQGGFECFTASPIIHPGIRLGWQIGDMRLTVDGSALFIPAQYVSLGGSSLWTSQFSAFTGLQGTATIEEPLSGGGIAYFGLGLLWTRSWYQTWLFFSDDPSLLLYPRVFGGYVF